MNHILSYSLYGKYNEYYSIFRENYPLFKYYFPDWQLQVHIENDCPKYIHRELLRNKAVVFTHKKSKGIFGMTYRFMPLFYKHSPDTRFLHLQ